REQAIQQRHPLVRTAEARAEMDDVLVVDRHLSLTSSAQDVVARVCRRASEEIDASLPASYGAQRCAQLQSRKRSTSIAGPGIAPKQTCSMRTVTVSSRTAVIVPATARSARPISSCSSYGM